MRSGACIARSRPVCGEVGGDVFASQTGPRLGYRAIRGDAARRDAALRSIRTYRDRATRGARSVRIALSGFEAPGGPSGARR